MRRNRNTHTESVRISVPVVDLVRVMAKRNKISFKQQMSDIVAEWGLMKGMVKR
jgi:hypothetical protein